MRRAGRGIAVIAATVLALTLPSPASAQSEFYYAENSSAGFVSFDPYGERFSACDKKADGKGLYGQLKEFHSGKIHGEAIGRGEGNCEHRDFSIPEGTRLIVQACVYPGDAPLQGCKRYDNVYA